jgi:hypothetical protein
LLARNFNQFINREKVMQAAIIAENILDPNSVHEELLGCFL